MEEEKTLEEIVKERLATLPKIVQDAINSGHVTQNMRKLADTHKLHIDQWESLEKEVQYTLLGLQPAEELEHNIKNEVGVTDGEAHALTLSIIELVFEPIRQELERGLGAPTAQATAITPMEASRQQAIAIEKAVAVPLAPRVLPATPPPPPPQGVAKRAPISDTYLSSTPSHERSAVDGDPYREQSK